MVKMFFCAKVLMFLMAIKSTMPLTKYWKASDELENPNMWHPAKIPCAQDTVVFPKKLANLLYVPENNVRVKEVRLPMDGTIEFRGLILHGGKPTPDCVGETVAFKGSKVHAWSDPNNWSVKGSNLSVDDNYFDDRSAVPDLYKLPCLTDDVVLDTSLYSGIQHFPSRMQSVKSITVDGRKFSNINWILFESSITAADSMTVRIVGEHFSKIFQYGEPVCQENIPQEMCEYKRCLWPKCLEAIRPFYHCCKICGAEITIGTMEKFSNVKAKVLSELKNNLNIRVWIGVVSRSHVTDEKYRPTLYNNEWLTSKNNFYQIILTDGNTYDQISTTVAKKLIKVLEKEYKLLHGSVIQLSGIPWAGLSVTRGGWEALVMFFVVLAAFFAVLLYHYPPAIIRSIGTQYSAFTFARFENRSREGSLIQGISQLSLNKEFDNPMYKGYENNEDDKQTIAEDITEDSDVVEVEMETTGKSVNVVADGDEIKDETAFVKSPSSSDLVQNEMEDDGTY